MILRDPICLRSDSLVDTRHAIRLSSAAHKASCLVGQRHFESLIRHKILLRLTLRRSTVPSPPKSGEKVAGRPDEGAILAGRVREMPPHPNPLPQFVCVQAVQDYYAKSSNKMGGTGGGKMAMPNECFVKS